MKFIFNTVVLLFVFSFLTIKVEAQSNVEQSKTKLIGRVHLDSQLANESGESNTFETGFTRLRLGVEHTDKMQDLNYKFKFAIDFGKYISDPENKDIEIKDAYLELQKLPKVGNLKVGHFKVPFSLDEATSSNDILFINRNLVTDELDPGRQLGALLHNNFMDKRLLLQLGVFQKVGKGKDEDGNPDNSFAGNPTVQESPTLSGRVVFVPINNENEKSHIGLSYIKNANNKPEGEPSPDNNIIGTEYMYQYKKFTVFGEFGYQYQSDDSGNEGDGWIGSLAGSYILFGNKDARKGYKLGKGKFGGIKNTNKFNPSIKEKKFDIGTVELAARYDIAQADVIGQENEKGVFTAGLNWYLKNNLRFMVNYVHDNDKSVPDDEKQSLQTRLQFKF